MRGNRDGKGEGLLKKVASDVRVVWQRDTSRSVFFLVNGEGSLEPPLCRDIANGKW